MLNEKKFVGLSKKHHIVTQNGYKIQWRLENWHRWPENLKDRWSSFTLAKKTKTKLTTSYKKESTTFLTYLRNRLIQSFQELNIFSDVTIGYRESFALTLAECIV